MTPAARIEAAIYLLEKIDTERRPADDIVRGWIKARRFVGAKDRRALRERVYGILRRRSRLGWHLENENFKASVRGLVIADVILSDRDDPSEIFDGSTHAPKTMNNEEERLALALVGKHLEDPAMPGHVLVEISDWLANSLKKFLGERFMGEMSALNQPAPMDLRVNLARVTREQAQQSLNKDKVATSNTPLSPMGLRLAAHSDIARTKAFRTGLIEVQDEGSQLLALMTGAKSGMSVLDYCAGAGGKTLALADRMGLMGGESKGRLVASDTEESRLKRMDRRLERAKLTELIEHHVLSDGDDWHKTNEARFDRVLVDAPCTGTGTWRRHPELKKRLSEERLKELCATQADILNKTAPLVKPGGRLIYATCSLLPEENEAQMVAFLKAHTEFEVINWHIVWEEAMPKIPTPEAQRGHYLRLTPARHGTDGFFIAVLARKS